MRRVRRRFVLAVCLILNFVWISPITADCYFENKTHQENQEVPTPEPCLNCTCKHGALVCYLRICAELPDPPPAGCIVLHRHRLCCPELICADYPVTNGIEGRSETDNLGELNQGVSVGNACIDNGTVYSPGSAMGSSSICEYCYCIGGRQTCIKPKCLLNLEGCTPKFEHRSCCPVRYNCTGYYENDISSTTQQVPTKEPMVRGGCIVSGTYYSEGSRVLGIGHSACDNCYCVRGVLRCEPLSCAPDILGCTPVIKSGECCAASYSCNGTIEVQPKPNFGKFPVISKEYAKLSKEVQRHRPLNRSDKPINNIPSSTHYVVAKSNITTKKPLRDYTTTRNSKTTSGKLTTNDVDSILDLRTRPSTTYRKNTYDTTGYKFEGSTNKMGGSELPESSGQFKDPTTTAPSVSKNTVEDDIFQSLVDTFFGSEDNSTTSSDATAGYTSTTEDNLTNGYALNFTTVISTILSTLADLPTTTNGEELITSLATTDEVDRIDTTTTENIHNTTSNSTEVLPPNKLVTMLQTTDCISNTTVDVQNSTISKNTTETLDNNVTPNSTTGVTKLITQTTTTTTKDTTEVNLESRVKVDNITGSPYRKVSPEEEAILNLTVNKDKDYIDFDYNEPTLPPSLPNLRIIPFVAADALDTRSQNHNSADYPTADDRIDMDSPAYSLFSPPTKTEGGFVPKTPNIFDNLYPTPLSNLHITTVSPMKSHENNCLADEGEVKHGETVKAESCIMCVCLYGNVVCQQPQCPQTSLGCKSSDDEDITCCPKPACDESDIVSTPLSIITISDTAPSLDHVKDVVKTHLTTAIDVTSTQKPISTQNPVAISTQAANHSSSSGELSFDKVWELLFSSETTTVEQTRHVNSTISANNSATATTPTTINTSSKVPTSSSSSLFTTLQSQEETEPLIFNDKNSIGVGLLKLAGCNIYGRMYRVGKIISELSGPCLECRCSEVGVQCSPLKC